MTRRRRTFAAAAVALTSLGSPLAGQAGGTLGIGASYVEYEGFLPSGAAVVAPGVHLQATNLSFGAQAAWTLFESGNQVFQGSLAAAWLSAPRGPYRLELSASGSASQYAREPSFGSALGRTRVHVSRERAGGWLSVTSGGSFGERARVPLELGVAGWSVQDELTVVGTATATWIGSSRYLDLVGAVRWTIGPADLEARAGARPWAESPGGVGDAIAAAFAEVAAEVRLSGRWALSLSGGRYLSDPVRRVLAATHVSGGLRVRLGGPPSPAVTVSGSGVRRGSRISAEVSAARLEVAGAGSVRVIRVEARGARTVELMGDFTDWEPVALVRVASSVWELQRPLAPGVHRVNVRIDGGRWLVPAGTRVEENEFGGVVGVVVVP